MSKVTGLALALHTVLCRNGEEGGGGVERNDALEHANYISEDVICIEISPGLFFSCPHAVVSQSLLTETG